MKVKALGEIKAVKNTLRGILHGYISYFSVTLFYDKVFKYRCASGRHLETNAKSYAGNKTANRSI